MLANYGVDMLYWFPTHNPASATGAREVSLLDTRVDGLERSQEGDERRRKFIEGRDLRSEESVTTTFRLCEEKEGSQTGWLELVGNIRVPDGRCYGVIDFEVEARFQIPGAALD